MVLFKKRLCKPLPFQNITRKQWSPAIPFVWKSHRCNRSCLSHIYQTINMLDIERSKSIRHFKYLMNTSVDVHAIFWHASTKICKMLRIAVVCIITCVTVQRNIHMSVPMNSRNQQGAGNTTLFESPNRCASSLSSHVSRNMHIFDFMSSRKSKRQ